MTDQVGETGARPGTGGTAEERRERGAPSGRGERGGRGAPSEPRELGERRERSDLGNTGGGSGVYGAMYARTETPSGPTTRGLRADSRPSRPELVHSYVASAGPEFTDFYRTSWPSVARALGLALGDQDLAVEATDEAMARAYPRWDKLRGYDNPAGWVYRVGLNWARSYHRRLARRLPFAHPGVAEAAEVADPEIRRALLDLPLRQRTVVVCRLLLDWSVDDTATALGVRPGTVRSRLHRALQSLEASLDHLR